MACRWRLQDKEPTASWPVIVPIGPCDGCTPGQTGLPSPPQGLHVPSQHAVRSSMHSLSAQQSSCCQPHCSEGGGPGGVGSAPLVMLESARFLESKLPSTPEY